MKEILGLRDISHEKVWEEDVRDIEELTKRNADLISMNRLLIQRLDNFEKIFDEICMGCKHSHPTMAGKGRKIHISSIPNVPCTCPNDCQVNMVNIKKLREALCGGAEIKEETKP